MAKSNKTARKPRLSQSGKDSSPSPKRAASGKSPASKKGASSSKSPTPPKKAAAFPSDLKIKASVPVEIKPPSSKSSASLVVAAGADAGVQTVVYIHGIGNKPTASILKCQWDSALFGANLGDRTRMAYWVNREYYPTPSEETCATGDLVNVDDDEASTRAIMSLAGNTPVNEQAALESEIKALTADPARQAFLYSIAEKMIDRSTAPTSGVGAATVSAKLLPLPAFLRRLITRKLTRAFMRDVNDFLFQPDRREAMEQSLTERLAAGGGPFVVIAHSQGTMIAYNVLRQLNKSDCDVRLFVTIGSPLGLTEVKDVLRQWVPGGVLRVPDCVTRWVNVADLFDPVAIDHNISNDYEPQGMIENHSGFLLNPDSPHHPHSGTGYLKTEAVQSAVTETVGRAFSQPVGRTIIAKDLVGSIEDSLRRERHQTLIQLAQADSSGDHKSVMLSVVRQQLRETIESLVKKSGDDVKDAEIDLMKRFIAAKLTRLEIESLRTQFKDLQIERVWRNSSKRALIHLSTNTIQARPANLGYAALGRNITWAVLDTGVRADHPHFALHKNIERQFDCTNPGEPVEVTGAMSAEFDKNGHGTHVAGIIAGYGEVPLKKGQAKSIFPGMAPEGKIFAYKVLNDQGNGKDSWIIKALDHIADLNDEAGRLVIQGVNLSLGGSFDPSVYGCGHTPLCQELRRLWGQGVLVVLAAGNEGYALLQTADGEVPSNIDLSIGDPANLEEAIAVGSIHKSNPHTYGISYFSSRGPTADGRRKPDLVAPGEQILSAFYGYDPNKLTEEPTAQDLYVEMSGTSMAAPHVSGILAAFLSMRREFIGYPNRVKTLLLENCTDLNRDPFIQGFGMPNLIKMLANS
jgi:subtilisin family serine protease